MKKAKYIFLLVLVVCAYHVLAFLNLYNSSLFNVIAYYVTPPPAGGVELQRLPMFGGQKIAYDLIANRYDEFQSLSFSGEVSIAAILSIYGDENPIPESVVKARYHEVVSVFVSKGYDLSRCESNGKSTAQNLSDWGFLDTDTKNFLSAKLEGKDMFTCVN